MKFSSAQDHNDRQSHATGFRFCLESNCWVAAAGCDQKPLPEELPVEASSFVSMRQTCADVQHDLVNAIRAPYVSQQGYMLGPDCLPRFSADQCCSNCGRYWSSAQRLSRGIFLLRTYAGPVARNRYGFVCECSESIDWDESSEYIHTIRRGSEGGTVYMIDVLRDHVCSS